MWWLTKHLYPKHIRATVYLVRNNWKKADSFTASSITFRCPDTNGHGYLKVDNDGDVWLGDTRLYMSRGERRVVKRTFDHALFEQQTSVRETRGNNVLQFITRWGIVNK